MTRGRLVWCALALGGCASTPAGPAGLSAVSLRVPAPASITSRPPAAAPLPAACHVGGTVAEASRATDGSVALRATRGGAAFADMTFVVADHVELTLFDGADDAFLAAQLDHVMFAAWTERDAFLYEPATRFAIGGYLVPYAEATPLWHYVGGGEFRAEVPVPPGLRPAASNGPLRASRSCDEMNVVAPWRYDQSIDGAAPVAGITLEGYETVELAPGASLPLATEPGGPPVAFLEPTETIAVQVRDAPENTTPPSGAAAGFAYVAWDTGTALVFGWASRALLGPTTGGGGRWAGGGCSARFGYQASPRTFRQCETDIPLLVRGARDAEPTVVGTLGGEALFRVEVGDREELSVVHPELAGFSMSLRDDASFLVRTRDLAACPEVVLAR